MASTPYTAALMPILSILPKTTTLSLKEQAISLRIWHTSDWSATTSSDLTPLVLAWLTARDALINTFILRTLCSRCYQTPQIFPTSFTQQLEAHHRLPKPMGEKWEKLMKDMNVPPECLSEDLVKEFALRAWEIECAFVEGSIGGKGCGGSSWSGYFDEVEIV